MKKAHTGTGLPTAAIGSPGSVASTTSRRGMTWAATPRWRFRSCDREFGRFHRKGYLHWKPLEAIGMGALVSDRANSSSSGAAKRVTGTRSQQRRHSARQEDALRCARSGGKADGDAFGGYLTESHGRCT